MFGFIRLDTVLVGVIVVHQRKQQSEKCQQCSDDGKYLSCRRSDCLFWQFRCGKVFLSLLSLCGLRKFRQHCLCCSVILVGIINSQIHVFFWRILLVFLGTSSKEFLETWQILDIFLNKLRTSVHHLSGHGFHIRNKFLRHNKKECVINSVRLFLEPIYEVFLDLCLLFCLLFLICRFIIVLLVVYRLVLRRTWEFLVSVEFLNTLVQFIFGFRHGHSCGCLKLRIH